MTLQEELALSYYQRVSVLDEQHGVWLTRHTQSGRLAVEKHPSVYHLDVYRSLMAHPAAHTPRIYAAVEDGTGLTVIEEYISGTPLPELLKNGPLPESVAAGLAKQLCEIVAGLHGRTPPVVHRDIKPSNILVSDDGVLTLLDFNAAKPFTGASDRDTELIGTAGYAAPEQYGFAESSPRADQYAIGVLMAEMTRGGFSRSALSARPYDRIIERCTRMDPADRYDSVTDIVAELSSLFQSGDNAPKTNSSCRFIRWLPPGFRSLRIGYMLPMALWYLFAVWVGMTLQVEHTGVAELGIHRVFATLALLGMTFFLGNYLEIWERAGLARIRPLLLRWLAIAVCAALIFICAVLLAVILSEFVRS